MSLLFCVLLTPARLFYHILVVWSTTLQFKVHIKIIQVFNLLFRKRGAFLSLVSSNTHNWHREDHRELLRGMTMTVCDLAAITKPWHIEKRVGSLYCSRSTSLVIYYYLSLLFIILCKPKVKSFSRIRSQNSI